MPLNLSLSYPNSSIPIPQTILAIEDAKLNARRLAPPDVVDDL